MDRLQLAANTAVDTTNSTGVSQHFKGVWQSVKAVCALLGNLETLHITNALDALGSACLQFAPSAVMLPQT
jgi:hypothetical protein